MSGGTPTYRSDDHKRDGEVTFKTDIWSWGVSMLEMFAGDIYWRHGRDARNVLDNLLAHGSRYDIIPRMPERFEALLYRCFEDDPDKRPDDMRRIALELQDIYADETGAAYPRPEREAADPTLDVLNNRAVSMLDLGKADEAGRLWAEILEARPDFVEAIYNRNLHFWKSGRITDAEMAETMTRVRHAHPDDWLPAYLLGRVQIERGDAAAALKIFEALPQEPASRREVAYGLAMAQNSLGRDRKLTWEFKPDSSNVSAVSLSFDGWHALTGGDDGQVRIWEVSSRKCTAVLDGHSARIHAVTLSEEERTVLTASADKTLRLWDPVTAKCLFTLSGHQGPVRAGAMTPNAKHVLSGSEDGTLMLWESGTGKRVRIFMGHRGGVNDVAITRCGNYALSASSDCTLKQWDLWTGKCLRTFDNSDSRITSVCVSHDGSLMLSACETQLQLWSLKTAKLVRSIRAHSAEIFSVCLNEAGQYALSATGMGTIKVWDIQTGQCLRSLQGHAPAALSRDGRYAITAGKRGDFKIWAVHIDGPSFPAQYVLCE
ncbi:MAG: protein kinase [Candidatus Hydrogenedentes bacterium]|nr:protein kinase [Candidatus Hydrogenedentota bacterium]